MYVVIICMRYIHIDALATLIREVSSLFRRLRRFAIRRFSLIRLLGRHTESELFLHASVHLKLIVCDVSLTTPNTTQISSIEILPSQLPLDASRHFSSALLPYIHSLILDPRSKSQTPIAQALRRATIVENGALTEAHVGLSSLLDRRSSTTASPKRKQVLILGSGLVAGPAVDVIAARKDVDLIVASNSLLSAQALIKDHPTARAVLLNASDRDALEQLVGLADVVIS